MSFDAYTVGWVCVLDCELNAARALLDEEDEPLEPALHDENLYILGRVEKHNVVITFTGAGAYGTNSAAQAVTNLIRTFPNIRFGLMVGVGGAVPSAPHPKSPSEDIRLGDVVVSEPKGNHGEQLHVAWQRLGQLKASFHMC
jgi:nucleoside phosphorylase